MSNVLQVKKAAVARSVCLWRNVKKLVTYKVVFLCCLLEMFQLFELTRHKNSTC